MGRTSVLDIEYGVGGTVMEDERFPVLSLLRKPKLRTSQSGAQKPNRHGTAFAAMNVRVVKDVDKPARQRLVPDPVDTFASKHFLFDCRWNK